MLLKERSERGEATAWHQVLFLQNGCCISRGFTRRPGVHPFDEIKWENRKASISNEKGETIFEQADVEVPV